METKLTNTLNTWNENGKVKSLDDLGFNISEKHKTFLWLLDKTGTSHAKKVLSNFDFCFYKFLEREKILDRQEIIQQHHCNFFPGHENYNFFVTVRNPYSRFLSSYFFDNKGSCFVPSVKDFENFLSIKLYEEKISECYSFHYRTPDYFVRLENLFEDYQHIPFVKNSQLNESGKLFDLCSKKVNENPTKVRLSEFYTPHIADMVYFSTQNYFEMFGYDKNSWKK